MLVGDPVQTHLDPGYQQTVVIPAREMLAGEGSAPTTGAPARSSTSKRASELLFSSKRRRSTTPTWPRFADRWRAARVGLRGAIAP